MHICVWRAGLSLKNNQILFSAQIPTLDYPANTPIQYMALLILEKYIFVHTDTTNRAQLIPDNGQCTKLSIGNRTTKL